MFCDATVYLCKLHFNTEQNELAIYNYMFSFTLVIFF